MPRALGHFADKGCAASLPGCQAGLTVLDPCALPDATLRAVGHTAGTEDRWPLALISADVGPLLSERRAARPWKTQREAEGKERKGKY